MTMNHLKFSSIFPLIIASSHAAVVWSDDLSAYSDGDPITGATAVGDGTWNNNGNIAANASGQLLATSDGGRDSVQIDSNTAVQCGVMSFDLAFLGDSTTPPETDNFFFQLTEGGRSTTANPISGFANTVDAGNHNISTDATAPSNLKYFFNTTATAYDYVGPDSTTYSINPGTYHYWVDTTRVNGNGTSTTNGTATPSQVSTIVTNMFNGQNGESWVYDNFVMDDLSVAHVPEPSSTMALAVSLLGLGFIRRRK